MADEGVRTRTVPVPGRQFDAFDEAQFRRMVELFMQDTQGRFSRLSSGGVDVATPWATNLDSNSNATVGAGFDTIYNHAANLGDTATLLFNTDDETVCTPFYVQKTVTLDAYVLDLPSSGGAGDTIKLGIYRPTSDADPYPDALITSSVGTLADLSATGLHTVSMVGDTTLTPGLYWLWVIGDEGHLNSFSLRALSATDHFMPQVFPDDDPAVSSGMGGPSSFNFDHTSFEVPATFPTKTPVTVAAWPMMGFEMATP